MIIYRASALGGCTKALIASRLGYEPLPVSERTQLIFNEGNLHEEDVVARLRSDGYEIFNTQEQHNLHVFGDVYVQGHIDGMINHPDWRNYRLLEIKSMAQESFDSVVKHGWEAPGLMQKYKWQISAYMHMTSLEGRLVAKNRNRGNLHILDIERPFYNLSDIKQRVIFMEARVARGELPNTCDTSNFPCPFRYLHEEDDPEVLEDAALLTLAKFYKRVQAEEANVTAKLKVARKALRTGLGDRKKVELDGAKVTVYSAKNPPSWDVKAMEKDGIEVEKYKTQGTSERMRVELTEANEES